MSLKCERLIDAFSASRFCDISRIFRNCLGSINGAWFGEQPPAEYAGVSFAQRTLEPLVQNTVFSRQCTISKAQTPDGLWILIDNIGQDVYTKII